MYDPIFAKSFSRYERRRFGCCALILSLIIALSICSNFKPHLHPLSAIGEAVNLQLSISAIENMLVEDDDISNNSNQTVGTSSNLQKLNNAAPNMLVLNETNAISQRVDMLSQHPEPELAQSEKNSNQTVGTSSNLQTSNNAAPNMLVLNETNAISQRVDMPSQHPKPEPAQSEKNLEPLCRVLKTDADYCEIEGDVRVDSNSSTVFLVRPRSMISEAMTRSWIIQPYPRRGITYVKKWTVTLAADDDDRVPKCAKNHTLPALLFSIGGYSGNHFHDFADLILPLYITSSEFKRDVHFLAADYKPWWPWKFRGVLDRLTRHGLLDIHREKDVHCYNKIIAGLQFHKELVIDQSFKPSSGVSMYQFRQLLRQTYSMERKNVIKWTKGHPTRPRLMIISRKRTRILTNEAEVSRVARKLGYEVVLAEGDTSANLTKFAQLVNSCDVMMGIHGAGLTNMVFLPDNAILIQIVPLGAIDIFAKLDFGNPAPGMNIRYLEYKIETRESSLVQQYQVDDPVIKDPKSVHRKGWGKLREVYLDNQNVTIDIHKFKGTLAKGLNLLRH